MGNIPDWTADAQATPQPSYRRIYPDESGAVVAGDLANLAGSVERSQNEIHAQNVNYARSQASTALIDHELAVKTQTEQIRQDVASGKLSWDQAAPTFQKWQASQQAPDIANLDPMGQELLERGMKRNAMQGTFAIDGIAAAGRRQSFADNFSTTMDTLSKLSGMHGADIQSINNQIDAYRPQALEAGIPAATVDKSINEFKERNWFNQATQRAMEAKDNPQALGDLRHDLVDDDGLYAGRLDVAKRDILERSVINQQLILQARAEHEADKREAKAQSALGHADEQISTGIPMTPDMWDNLQRVTKGTSFEDEFKQRIKDEATVQNVLRQPLDAQMKYVEDRQALLEEQGGSLRDRANLMRLQTAVKQNITLMQRSPLQFGANRNGTSVEPLDFSAIQPSDPVKDIAAGVLTPGASSADQPNPKAAFGAQIADRMATLKALRTQYGGAIPPSPLLPQEVSTLTNALDNASPKDKATMLVGLRSAMNDDQAYRGAMLQIAPRSPVTAIAGSMVSSSAPAATPTYFDKDYAPNLGDVAHVLRGEALLNPDKAGRADQEGGKGAIKEGMPMPKDEGPDGLRAAFSREAGDLFRSRPQLADSYYSVFKDAYASLLAEKGDMSGVGDPRLEKQALGIALGHMTSYSGQNISAPPGMDPSHFSSLLDNAVSSTAAELKASPKWLAGIRGYGVREVEGLGSGRYVLTSGGQDVLKPGAKSDRDVFTVDLRDQYLGARGLHRGVPDFRSAADQQLAAVEPEGP
jgi:hypothetical protein